MSPMARGNWGRPETSLDNFPNVFDYRSLPRSTLSHYRLSANCQPNDRAIEWLKPALIASMCPDEPQDHEPDAELIREVYARFGAAYYFSEVLHRGLSNAYVIAPFEGRDGVTGPRVDERMANAFSLTLGQLIESLRPWLSAHLLERLGAAARRRNYLAHHFWFEKAHLMFSDGDLAGLAHE